MAHLSPYLAFGGNYREALTFYHDCLGGELILQHHLIDEYRLMVHPVLLGSGQRLFREGPGTNLTLTNTVTTSTGVLVLTYQLAST